MTKIRKARLIGEPGRVVGVLTSVCKPDNPDTPKGNRTFNVISPLDMLKDVGRVMIAMRVRDEEVGNHFHVRVPNKDPEMFVLLRGKVHLWVEDLYGDTRMIPMWRRQGQAPMLCTIPPYVLHTFEVLSKEMVLVELQANPFTPGDTFGPSEFQRLRAAMK